HLPITTRPGPRAGPPVSNFVLFTTAIRAICPANGMLSGTLASGATFSVPIYRIAPGTALPPALLRENRPNWDTTYNGVELTMQKRLSNKWMVRGNFG